MLHYSQLGVFKKKVLASLIIIAVLTGLVVVLQYPIHTDLGDALALYNALDGARVLGLWAGLLLFLIRLVVPKAKQWFAYTFFGILNGCMILLSFVMYDMHKAAFVMVVTFIPNMVLAALILGDMLIGPSQRKPAP